MLMGGQNCFRYTIGFPIFCDNHKEYGQNTLLRPCSLLEQQKNTFQIFKFLLQGWQDPYISSRRQKIRGWHCTNSKVNIEQMFSSHKENSEKNNEMINLCHLQQTNNKLIIYPPNLLNRWTDGQLEIYFALATKNTPFWGSIAWLEVKFHYVQVASTIAFLAGSGASFITGMILGSLVSIIIDCWLLFCLGL